MNMSRQKRARVANLLLGLFSTCVALAIAEGVLRIVMRAETGEWPIITEYDPVLGWSLTPNAVAVNRTSEYTVREAINGEGLRGADVPLAKPPGETRVLLLGDSFTEGYSVDQDETVSAALAREVDDPHVRVLNAGTRGWSTDQELLFFQEHVGELAPDLSVVFFYRNDVCHNATDRTWRGHKPRFALDGDGLSLEGVPVPPPEPEPDADAAETGVRSLQLVQLLRRAWHEHSSASTPTLPLPWAPLSKSLDGHPCLHEGWALTERLLVEFQDEARALGTDLVIFWVPPSDAVYEAHWRQLKKQYGLDDEAFSPTADADRLGDICERQGLTCVIPIDRFRRAAQTSDAPLYYERDPHWAPAGHALAAEILAPIVRERALKTDTRSLPPTPKERRGP